MITDVQPDIVFDLEKSLDKSKLVQVQIIVQGKNGPFLRMQWKNPSDVKPTDKVIGNQSVLDEYKKEQAKKQAAQQNASIKFDRAKFDAFKADKDKRKNAMDYAKSCGIFWDEHSNPNINWMRCCMAVNKIDNISISIQPDKKLNLSNISALWNSLGKKEKMAELLKNNSRQELMDFAKTNGVTWKEDASSEGINWMRASMAIQKYIEGKSLLEISDNATFSPTSSQAGQSAINQPKVDESLVPIPANATERQKNLIGLANKITDEKDFELFKSTGMIAEDDMAKNFLKNKLFPRYQQWKTGSTAAGNVNGKRRVRGGMYFGKKSAESLGTTVFKGISKKLLASGIDTMRRAVSIPVLVSPRDSIAPLSCGDRSYRQLQYSARRDNYVRDVLRTLNTNYSIYSDDSNIDNSKYKSAFCKFDETKDGFCNVLSHIKSESPKLASECDRMSKVYKELIHMCGDNYKNLNFMLDLSNYALLENKVKSLKFEQERTTKTIKILRDNGLDNDAIVRTIAGAYDCRKLDLFEADGTFIKTIDLKELVGKDSDGYYYYDSYWTGMGYSASVQYKEHYLKPESTGLTKDDQKFYDFISSVDLNTYEKIQSKGLELVGMKITKKDINTGIFTDVDMTKLSRDEVDNMHGEFDSKYFYEPDDRMSPEIDDVIANLDMIVANCHVKRDLYLQTPHNSTVSKANKDGTDYSGNFNWIHAENLATGSSYYYPIKYTADQINQKIKTQLEQVPILKSEYLDGLRKFVDENGNGDLYDRGPAITDVEKKLSKARSYDLPSEDNIYGFRDTPIFDLIVDQLKDISNYCPQMNTARYNTKEKIHKYVEEKMEYKPFDFSTLKANQNNGNVQQNQNTIDVSKLRKLREELLSKVHCSIKACDDATDAKNQTAVKQGWDKGARNSSGKRLYGHISGVFNGSYEIKNSLQEEKFRENVTKLGETPKTYFHGTNHSGACGILGVTGHFIVPKDSLDASKHGLKYAGGMLGPGVYLADMAGKSAGYFGTWGGGYDKEGCLLICEAILGNHYTATDFSGRNASSKYDSVSMKAGTNTGRTILRADEWCVRNPDFVFPKYVMDMEVKNRVV